MPTAVGTAANSSLAGLTATGGTGRRCADATVEHETLFGPSSTTA
jgi:hypothetical protein